MFLTIVILALAALLVAAYYSFMWPQGNRFGVYPYQADREDLAVTLTFDDGPNPPYTEKIAAVLTKHGVRATFFALGSHVKKNPQEIKKLFEAGHEIGNHAYSHNFLKYFISPSLRKEVIKNQELIESIIGRRPKLFRSPWLIRNKPMFDFLNKTGLHPVGGVFSSQWEIYQPETKKFFKDVLKQVSPGKILIFHDGFDLFARLVHGKDRDKTAETLDLLIPYLKEKGYRFLTASEMLGLEPYF